MHFRHKIISNKGVAIILYENLDMVEIERIWKIIISYIFLNNICIGKQWRRIFGCVHWKHCKTDLRQFGNYFSGRWFAGSLSWNLWFVGRERREDKSNPQTAVTDK